MFNGLNHSPVLHRIKFDLFRLLHLGKTSFHHIFRHLAVDIQIMEHLRRIEFQIIVM